MGKFLAVDSISEKYQVVFKFLLYLNFNFRFHTGIGRTPYAAMFGRDADEDLPFPDEDV